MTQRFTIVFGEEKNSISTPMNGILFLAVTTSGGVFLQLPRRGRSNSIQNNAMMITTTDVTIAGTPERYGITVIGKEAILLIVTTKRRYCNYDIYF